MDELTKRVEVLERMVKANETPTVKPKRQQSEKQKENSKKLKEAFAKYSPDIKKEHPEYKQHEVFSAVRKKMKE